MKLKLLLFLIFLSATIISAQSPNKVLSQANKALGGEKALKTVRSWQMSGKITRQSDGASGAYQAFASDPNFYGESFDLNGFESAVGYNGKSGWMRDSKNGLRTLTGDASRDFQAETFIETGVGLTQKPKKQKSRQAEKRHQRQSGKLRYFNDRERRADKIVFRRGDKSASARGNPERRNLKIIDYGDYRKVDNIFEAFSIVSKIRR